MRQTSQAATEQQGLRDVERWKEKIEIRLDNRQVAFLFFGSALIACLLFILGVIVGKRLESRGHALAPEIEDPLALLDRVASTLPTVPTTVPAAPARPTEVAVSRAEAAPLAAAAAARRLVAAEAAAVAPPTRPAAKADESSPTTASAGLPAPLAKPAAKKPADKPEKLPVAAMTLALAEPTSPPPPPKAAPEPARAANPEIMPPSGLGPTPPAAVIAIKATVPAGAAAATAAPGKGRFMLQVGSFLERAEAEAFASSFASEHPIVITSEIPGKGTWYRVRVGDYHAFKEAVDAKLSFEHRFSKIALVVGPL